MERLKTLTRHLVVSKDKNGIQIGDRVKIAIKGTIVSSGKDAMLFQNNESAFVVGKTNGAIIPAISNHIIGLQVCSNCHPPYHTVNEEGVSYSDSD